MRRKATETERGSKRERRDTDALTTSQRGGGNGPGKGRAGTRYFSPPAAGGERQQRKKGDMMTRFGAYFAHPRCAALIARSSPAFYVRGVAGVCTTPPPVCIVVLIGISFTHTNILRPLLRVRIRLSVVGVTSIRLGGEHPFGGGGVRKRNKNRLL